MLVSFYLNIYVVAMIDKKTLAFVSIALLLIGAFLYSVSEILMPFAMALFLGYFFAPLVNKIHRLGASRAVSSVLVLCFIIALLVMFSVTIIPLLYKQIVILAQMAIDHKADIQNFVAGIINQYDFSPQFVAKLTSYIDALSGTIMGFMANVLTNIIQSGIAAINILSLIFVLPFVLYYVMADWHKISNAVESMVPRRMAPYFHALTKELHITLSGYVRGQLMVCMIMATYYSLAYTIIGVESGIALGIISGALTFIPYAGALFSIVLTSLIVVAQFGSLKILAIVIGAFLLAQFLEGYFIVPKLVGSKVKVHPVWIIFGLLAGGAIMGFLGVLIALPLTAVIAVIIRFMIKDYKESSIYKA